MKKLFYALLAMCCSSSLNAFQLPFVTLHSCDPSETYFIRWEILGPGEIPPRDFIGCFKDVLFFDQSWFHENKDKFCSNHPNCSLPVYVGSMNDPNYTLHLIATASIDASTMTLTAVHQSEEYQGFKVLANKCKNMIDIVAPGTEPEPEHC